MARILVAQKDLMASALAEAHIAQFHRIAQDAVLHIARFSSFADSTLRVADMIDDTQKKKVLLTSIEVGALATSMVSDHIANATRSLEIGPPAESPAVPRTAYNLLGSIQREVRVRLPANPALFDGEDVMEHLRSTQTLNPHYS